MTSQSMVPASRIRICTSAPVRVDGEFVLSLGEKAGGKREGWRGVGPGAETWLDEFITWRQLGYNMTSRRDDYDLLWWIPFAMILRDAAKHRRTDKQFNGTSRQQYVKQTQINAPPDVVFRFHENPDALLQLIPPWENMKLVESAGSLRPGSRVVLRGSLGVIPIQWVAIHTKYDPPHLFADCQESGPFASWYHRHRFLDDGQGGTLLRDEVEYEVPFGVIGRWLGGWLVRRKLEAMFAYRHAKTRSLIESGEWTGASSASER